MFSIKLASTVAAIALSASAASAAVVLSSVPGTDPYSGPAPTYNFETAAPFTGGLITTGDAPGIRAQPFGSTGNYATVGPADGTPGTLSFASFATISAVSFIWGSVDTYNTLNILDKVGGLLATYTGAQVVALANGNQTDPFTNPLVTFTFTGLDANNVGAFQFNSSQNAFEIDNVSVIGTAVPEPTTWAMMLFGFGLVGSLVRRRNQLVSSIA